MCDEGKGAEVVFRNGLEPWHLLVVAIVFIAMLGPRKPPGMARALGRSMRIPKSEAQTMKADAPAGDASSQVGGGFAADPVVDRSESAAHRREPVVDR